jgi:hypothetical protein
MHALEDSVQGFLEELALVKAITNLFKDYACNLQCGVLHAHLLVH